LQILEDSGKILVIPVSRPAAVSAILEDTSHCQNMSIADTGRFWKILVIPVLQILEDSRKYWLYQYCRYWKILENTGNTSIADNSGKILVIPVSRPAASYYPNILIQVLGLIFQNIQHISLPNSK
jgi:hypothetical protein